jgi:hypothetical protein
MAKIDDEIAKLEAEKQKWTIVSQRRTEIAQKIAKKKQLQKEIHQAKYGAYIEAGKRTMAGFKLGFHNVGTAFSQVGKSLGTNKPQPQAMQRPAMPTQAKPMKKMKRMPMPAPQPAVGSEEWLRRMGLI